MNAKRLCLCDWLRHIFLFAFNETNLYFWSSTFEIMCVQYFKTMNCTFLKFWVFFSFSCVIVGVDFEVSKSLLWRKIHRMWKHPLRIFKSYIEYSTSFIGCPMAYACIINYIRNTALIPSHIVCFSVPFSEFRLCLKRWKNVYRIFYFLRNFLNANKVWKLAQFFNQIKRGNTNTHATWL